MIKESSFIVEGLDCSEEIQILKKVFHSKEGIEQLSFDVLQAKMTVSFDSNLVSTQSILDWIAETGMRGRTFDQKEPSLSPWKKHGRLILTWASGCFLLLGWILPQEGAFWCYLLSIAFGTYFVLPKAWYAVRRLQPDMNLLMVIAIGGAIGIGHLSEGGTVAFLFSLSLLLEHWSLERARRAIEALMSLSPLEAHVISNKGTEKKPTDAVQVGTTILVRPGEKIPLDSKVVKGQTSVNQAPITGESLPVMKKEGDTVYAGSINEEGAIECKTIKTASNSSLARMIELIEKARQKRAISERWVDQFARVYTPLMIVLAIGVALIPPLFLGLSWVEWFYRALVILVIACPCALVISTPVSIVSGLTAAARKGILVKGGVYLEAARKLNVLAVDKTGTLTKGEPKVQQVIPLNHHTEEELLMRAAALEMPSEHPLAKAILKKAQECHIHVERASDFQITKGKGAEGTFRGQRYWIGSHRFMHEMKQETEEIHKLVLQCEDAGHSIIAIGTDKHVCGLITVADEVREEMYSILTAIKASGVKKIVMLTGDHTPAAEAIGKHAGVDEVYAELLPEDKVAMIEKIKKSGETVAMVGDGINDAPAMAAAHFGVAMGAIGTDVAIETADIALMSDDLALFPFLIHHSKKTVRIIQQNITFALLLKLTFLGLAGVGLASLWMAIAVDAGASLLVVFNGLRLLSLPRDVRPSRRL